MLLTVTSVTVPSIIWSLHFNQWTVPEQKPSDSRVSQVDITSCTQTSLSWLCATVCGEVWADELWPALSLGVRSIISQAIVQTCCYSGPVSSPKQSLIMALNQLGLRGRSQHWLRALPAQSWRWMHSNLVLLFHPWGTELQASHSFSIFGVCVICDTVEVLRGFSQNCSLWLCFVIWEKMERINKQQCV